MIHKNKYYYNGRYWDGSETEADKKILLSEKPQLYYKLFPRPKVTVKLPKDKFHIHQIYYNEESFKELDGGFIPYKNTFTHNYENDIILEVWRKREWINADYVGVLSWRFYEKTGLTSADINPKKPCVVFFPTGYEKYQHPFSRKGFESVNQMVEACDNYSLFDFKLKDYPIKQNVWCNYWIASPKVFDLYCTKYLSKAIEFFKTRPEYHLTEFHRGRNVPAMTFFLEGLFSVFLQQEKIKYENKRYTV